MSGEISVTLPLALAMTAGSALLTIGGAWAVMRARVQEMARRQNVVDADVREVFKRLSELERDVVTRDNLSEFRRELIGEIHGLRDLIEKLRTPRAPRS